MLEAEAVVTNASIVKNDLAVGGIHDALSANLVGTCHDVFEIDVG